MRADCDAMATTLTLSKAPSASLHESAINISLGRLRGGRQPAPVSRLGVEFVAERCQRQHLQQTILSEMQREGAKIAIIQIEQIVVEGRARAADIECARDEIEARLLG